MPRFTGPESLKEAEAGINVRLDNGNKLTFEPENGVFRLYLLGPQGKRLFLSTFTAERLRNIGQALIVLAGGEPPPETPPATESGGQSGSRFSLLELD